MTSWLIRWWPTLVGVPVVVLAAIALWPSPEGGGPASGEAVVIAPEDIQGPERMGRAEDTAAVDERRRELDARAAARDASKRGGPGSGAPSSDPSQPSQRDIQRALADVDVELYETSWCPYCRKARAFLGRNGVAFRAYDIERDAAARRRQSRLAPGSGVPVVVIDGKSVRGYQPEKMEALLKRAVAQQLER